MSCILSYLLPLCEVTLSLITIRSIVIDLWHRPVWTNRSDLILWSKISTSTKIFKRPRGVITTPLCLLNYAIFMHHCGSNPHRDVKKKLTQWPQVLPQFICKLLTTSHVTPDLNLRYSLYFEQINSAYKTVILLTKVYYCNTKQKTCSF